MADLKSNKTGPRDLLSLARTSSMPELLAALLEERTLNETNSPVPPRANQIARLVISKTVLLIRLGTQAELADATVEVVRALASPNGKLLAERFPQAHRLLSGASVSLRAATPPSSSGGELAVLRMWKGKAQMAVKLVVHADGEEMSRAELRRRLGVNESYLSHLLADLEAAGLLVRIRDGRTVTVHVGPTGKSDHVRKFLLAHNPPEESATVKKVQDLFRSILDSSLGALRAITDLYVEGREDLERQLDRLRYALIVREYEIEESTTNPNRVVCRIRVSGRMQLGAEDGKDVDRSLVWVASTECGEIAKVESWTRLDGLPSPSRQGTEALPTLNPPDPGLLPSAYPLNWHEEVLDPRSQSGKLLHSPGEGVSIYFSEEHLLQWGEREFRDLPFRRTLQSE